MARPRETGSTESRAKLLRDQNPEYTSPAREVLNSALSLVAVVGITLVSGVLLNRLLARNPA